MIDEEKFNIVTSFYPMYIATSNIVDGIDGVTLENMTSEKQFQNILDVKVSIDNRVRDLLNRAGDFSPLVVGSIVFLHVVPTAGLL